MGNQDTVYIGMRDYDGESSGFSVGIPSVGGVLPLGPQLLLLDALRIATADFTVGLISNQKLSVNDQFVSSSTNSGNPLANRENKWLVTYEDVSPYLDILNTIANPGYLKVFNTEIPTAKLSLRQAGTSVVYVDGGANNVNQAVDWVTAFEAIARSPYGGGCNVLKIEDVSRNT